MKGTFSSGLIGSGNLQASVAGANIITFDDGFVTRIVTGFALLNDADCHISINGFAPVFLRANQGISTDGLKVRSAVFSEGGVGFNWAANFEGYRGQGGDLAATEG